MMKTPLISVIVPVYLVEKYLRRCVDSILAQTYTNLEVILVDDGSPDDSPAICDEYAERDKRIRVIHKPNGGLSSARNAALDSPPSGEYLFFLDSDDFLHPYTIETLVRIAGETGADLVQCKFIRGCGDVFPADVNLDTRGKVFDNTTIFYSDEQSLCVCGGLYRAELWSDIRMPLGVVNEDDATSWKAYFRCRKIVVIPAQFYYYYRNPDGTMARLRKKLRLDFINHYHERILFFREKGMELHAALSQWRFCLPLMICGVTSAVATGKQRTVMWKEYKENVWGALRCPKVPLAHKMLFVLYRCFPQTCRFFAMRLIRR